MPIGGGGMGAIGVCRGSWELLPPHAGAGNIAQCSTHQTAVAGIFVFACLKVTSPVLIGAQVVSYIKGREFYFWLHASPFG